MTTLAFRDGILAADTVATNSSGMILPWPVSKIYGGPDFLAGGTGSLAGLQSFFRWIEKDRILVPTPEFKVEDEDDMNILILRGHAGHVKVIQYWAKVGYEEHILPLSFFMAWGTGAKYAIGAMVQGASAKEAVQTATIYDVWTGGEVESISF